MPKPWMEPVNVSVRMVQRGVSDVLGVYPLPASGQYIEPDVSSRSNTFGFLSLTSLAPEGCASAALATPSASSVAAARQNRRRRFVWVDVPMLFMVMLRAQVARGPLSTSRAPPS